MGTVKGLNYYGPLKKVKGVIYLVIRLFFLDTTQGGSGKHMGQ